MRKVFGVLLLLLGMASIGAYFLLGDKFSEFTIVFDSDGGTSVASQTVKSGEKVIKPTDPTKDDNEFVAWQLNGQEYNFNNDVTSNITLKANWKEIVKFDVVAKLDNEVYTTKVKDGDTFTFGDLDMPDKEGNVIKFYLESDEEYDVTSPVKENLNLVAKYVEVKQFVVKFNSNGGMKVDDIIVNEGEKVKEPKVSRDGYIFNGWYLKEELYDFDKPVTSDMTLNALWNDGTQVTVTFMVDGKIYKKDQIKENTKATKPTNPTKSGYSFVEWQLDGVKYDFSRKVTKDITLTATFKDAVMFTISFNSNGGTAIKSQTIADGKKVSRPTDPTKPNYEFVEWQLDGVKYDFNKTVTEDIMLTAKWVAAKPKYTVTFNTDGGTEVASQIVPEGSKVSKPNDPTKKDNKFIEWKNGNETYDFGSEVKSNLNLTAIWRTLNKYSVTFDSDGGTSITGQLISEGSKASKPTNPTKKGFEFVEWQLDGVKYDFNNGVTDNITLKAKWEEKVENEPIDSGNEENE